MAREAAAVWMRSAELRLMPTAPLDRPAAEKMHACRRAVKELRYRLEAAGTPPAQIVGEVRAVLAEHGYLRMVETFVNRPPVSRS